jgi:hypothetical protein
LPAARQQPRYVYQHYSPAHQAVFNAASCAENIQLIWLLHCSKEREMLQGAEAASFPANQEVG